MATKNWQYLFVDMERKTSI